MSEVRKVYLNTGRPEPIAKAAPRPINTRQGNNRRREPAKSTPTRQSAVSKRARELVAEGMSLADASARAQWEVTILKEREPTLKAWAAGRLATLARERSIATGESPAEASRVVAAQNRPLVEFAYASGALANLPVAEARDEIRKMVDTAAKNADELTRAADLQQIVAMLREIQ